MGQKIDLWKEKWQAFHWKLGSLLQYIYQLNAIHQATSYLVNNYGKIVIEDLNVKAMVKNRKLSQALSDASFGEVSRQLAYKAAWNAVINSNQFIT